MLQSRRRFGSVIQAFSIGPISSIVLLLLSVVGIDEAGTYHAHVSRVYLKKK